MAIPRRRWSTRRGPGATRLQRLPRPGRGRPGEGQAAAAAGRRADSLPDHFTYCGGTPHGQEGARGAEGRLGQGRLQGDARGLTDTYYDVIQNPANANKYDVTGPAGVLTGRTRSTVIPPLFDSRVNLSPALQRLGLRLLRQPGRQRGDRRRATTRPDLKKRQRRGATWTSSSPRRSPTSRSTSQKFSAAARLRRQDCTDEPGDRRLPGPRAGSASVTARRYRAPVS